MKTIHARSLLPQLVVAACVASGLAACGGSSSSGSSTLPPGIDFRPLNDTGIQFCGAADTGINAPCLGDEPPGQDADFGRDADAALEKLGAGAAAFDYSRQCNNGDFDGEGDCPSQPLRGDLPQQWGCTRDNVTGLTWELKDTSDLSRRFINHHYSNSSSGDVSLCGGSLGDQPCTVEAYVTAVNAEGLCGHQDWRLPDLHELLSLVHYGRQQTPWQDTDFFPEASSVPLWSSTADAGSDNLWVLDMNAALPGNVPPDSAQSLRLVRGTPLATKDTQARAHCTDGLHSSTPPQRYDTSHPDSVVDLMTGLMWQRCVTGLSGEDCAQGNAVSQDWATALEQAGEDTHAGFDDWRLPNIRELASLHDTCAYDPALSPLLFPNVPGEPLWSASPGAPSDAWQMSALDGQHQLATRGSSAYSLRVRGGSPRLAPPRSDTLVLRAGAPGDTATYQPGQSESYLFTARAIGPEAALGLAEVTACEGGLSGGTVTVEVLHQGHSTAVDCDALPQSLPLPDGLPYNSDGALEYTWEARWTPDAALADNALGGITVGALALRFTSADDIALVSPPVQHQFRLYDINQPPRLIPTTQSLLTCVATSYSQLDCEHEVTPTGQLVFPVGIDIEDPDTGTGGMFTEVEFICLAEDGCDPDDTTRLLIPSMSNLQTLVPGYHYRYLGTLPPTSSFLGAITVFSESPMQGDYQLHIESHDNGNTGSCSYESINPCLKHARAEILIRVR
ncbi:DUF1566 domain-containing protein [Alcanivorax sp. JB21]|uniref:Lcl C-terminal domain-containing protein n=1 Tax=Alcanivorax limicola TaxID=2874102 RepID=UPI001CBEAC82|nr:DUF1566 domain-containing protein [Alcanivorax limicola]MBZ2190208.1 DUF1566 domain-containing protein [Alcanivorax limicola]